MKISTKNISETQIVVSIVADDTILLPLKRHVLTHFKNRVKVPGFRPGKAPLEMVEKHLDSATLQSEFLEEAINNLYGKAISAENFRPISQPEISIKKFVPFTILEFDAKIDVISKIVLPEYKNIHKKLPEVVVTPKDIDDVLNSLNERQATKKDVSRPAQNGDEIEIDFAGVDKDGKPVNGADGKKYPLILGSNTFIPGFEPNLIGLKTNEEKTFNIKFPKDYNPATLRNKSVNFTVLVHSVREIIKDKIDDNFAIKVSPFKTLKELRTDIKTQLTQEKLSQANQALQNEIVNEIASQSQLTVPEVLVEQELDRTEQEERQNLAYRGQTWQEHLQEEGITEVEHRTRNKKQAEESVKAGLVLSEISDQEAIKVTDEEVENQIMLLKSRYADKTMQAELDKPQNRKDIKNRLITEKLLQKLVEYATQK